jgi:hypothetical protein
MKERGNYGTMGKATRLYIKEIHVVEVVECYGTNSGAPSDGRHLTPGRPTGPQDETLPSIVLMVLMI